MDIEVKSRLHGVVVVDVDSVAAIISSQSKFTLMLTGGGSINLEPELAEVVLPIFKTHERVESAASRGEAGQSRRDRLLLSKIKMLEEKVDSTLSDAGAIGKIVLVEQKVEAAIAEMRRTVDSLKAAQRQIMSKVGEVSDETREHLGQLDGAIGKIAAGLEELEGQVEALESTAMGFGGRDVDIDVPPEVEEDLIDEEGEGSFGEEVEE